MLSHLDFWQGGASEKCSEKFKRRCAAVRRSFLWNSAPTQAALRWGIPLVTPWADTGTKWNLYGTCDTKMFPLHVFVFLKKPEFSLISSDKLLTRNLYSVFFFFFFLWCSGAKWWAHVRKGLFLLLHYRPPVAIHAHTQRSAVFKKTTI